MIKAKQSILVTGFGAFGEVVNNPSERLIRHLETAAPAGQAVDTCVLPVSYRRAPTLLEAILSAAEANRGPYDLILMLGVAAGSERWRVERYAHNGNSPSPDADGAPPPAVIAPDGPERLEATIAVVDLADALASASIPVELSNTAGSYLCNHMFYRALFHCQRSATATSVGFLHVPSDPETLSPGNAGLERFPFAMHLEALRIALAALNGSPGIAAPPPDRASAAILS